MARAADVLSNDDFRALLIAPQVSDEAKLNGVTTLIGDVTPLILNMVSLMAVRGDIGSFPEVFSTFQELANEHRGIAQAEVTSAVPLDDSRRERICVSLADITGKQVTMTESIDPQIIGGVVARVGDQFDRRQHAHQAAINARSDSRPARGGSVGADSREVNI